MHHEPFATNQACSTLRISQHVEPQNREKQNRYFFTKVALPGF